MTQSPAQAAALPLAFFPQLLDFSLDQIPLQHAQMLQEQYPVEVVDLVAKGPRQQILAPNLKRFALQILRSHGHKLRPYHVSAESRD
jgi:hypothetical protein